MKMHYFSLPVQTTRHAQFIDITEMVNNALQEIGIQQGICYLFVPHTTAAITINENADFTVQRDILQHLDKLIPWEDNYQHTEGNSAAHIKSSLLGHSCQVIVNNGRLLLGKWQGVFFCEFDGPRNRKVYIKTFSG